MKPFIAFDGEGITLQDGEHIYIMLSSNFETITNKEGLSTRECFNFFLKHLEHDAIFVSFYFTYDVNMLLKDLPPYYLEWLKSKNLCYIKCADSPTHYWRIEFRPRKWFSISLGARDSNNRFKSMAHIKIYDVFGFFQCSFGKALKEYGIGTKEEREEIESMKAKRSDFLTLDLASIEHYNRKECELLSILMMRVAEGCERLGIKMRSWHGAGAIAGQILRKYDVQKHIMRERLDVEDIARKAYFGGRIQTCFAGEIPGPVFAHDIVSAYPHAMLSLPSYENCQVERIEEYIPNANAIYHIRYTATEAEDRFNSWINPFAFRDSAGSISFPGTGEGWVWAQELETALAYWQGDISVIEGLSFRSSEEAPFYFVNDLFELRKEYKAAGDYTQLVIKLGLNSLYGKCAQRRFKREDKIPPFHNLLWAGAITATTRAALFRLAMISPKDVLAFATDGLFSRAAHCLPGTGELGSWEVETADGIFILKPGFYSVKNRVPYHIKTNNQRVDGQKFLRRKPDTPSCIRNYDRRSKTRGFSVREVDFDMLENEFALQGVTGSVEVDVRRFETFYSTNNYAEKWRRWCERPTTISFLPSTGVPLERDDGLYHIRHFPRDPGELSLPYEKGRFTEEEEEKYYDNLIGFDL